jgi:hypothetical protein
MWYSEGTHYSVGKLFQEKTKQNKIKYQEKCRENKSDIVLLVYN